jgi:hypothetical protein
LANKLRRLADLKDEHELNSFLTPDERAIIRKKMTELNAAIDSERQWQPSAAIVNELERVERESEAYGQAMYAANMAQVRDLAGGSIKGIYKPSDDESLRQRSAAAADKLAKLAEKHRIPVDGLDSLKRWALLNANGRYIGGLGSRK